MLFTIMVFYVLNGFLLQAVKEGKTESDMKGKRPTHEEKIKCFILFLFYFCCVVKELMGWFQSTVKIHLMYAFPLLVTRYMQAAV